MTKLVKKLLISLMALAMTVCCGFALLGTQPITANAATAEYGLWVGGVKVTSDNLVIDGNDNSEITGSATYDAENNILTLDNFSYTGAGYLYDDFIGNSAIIFAKNELTVKLVGTNVIEATGDRCFGISSYDLLTITDDTEDKTDGVLTITSEDLAIVVGTLSICNVTINATGPCAICVEDAATIINNAIINAIGTSEEALLVYDTFKVENSSLTLESQVGTALDCYDSVDSFYTINNSTLTINSQSKGIRCAFIAVSNSTIEISAVNEAICESILGGGYAPLFFDSHVVYAGDDSASATLITEPDDTTYENKYVKIVPAYDVWVAGVQFDASNLTIDSEDNNAITGSATYDAENNILTLDNFSYTGAGYNYTGNANALIYSTGIDLKIVLKGTNTLVGLVDVYEGISIEDGSLTIAGSNEDNETASLELTVKALCIYADGSLSIENVKLTTTTTALPTGSPTEAIFTYGDLSITNSEVTVIAGDSDGDGIIEFGYTQGIISDGNVVITGSIVNVAANGGGIGTNSRMTIDNSTVIIEGGTGGTTATATSITNSTVIISGEIAIETNTMYGGYFIVSNSNVEISAQEYAIHDLYYDEPLADYRLYDITGHVIYGGEDKESATILTEQVDIFGHKYLRFAPASKVTVNYGIDGVDNEEFTIEKGTTISLETPVIDGYIFIGWYNEDTLETAFDFSTPVTEDITIYAKFANYTQDIANINSQINGVKDSITSLQSSIDGKAEATELANSVTDLQGKIDALTNNYQLADATQQDEINTLKQQVSTLINYTIVLLNSKVSDIESEIADINSAISTNAGDITENADKITSLATQLTALQGIVNSLGDTYIDNTELSSLKTELVDADNQIKGLIETLTAKVTDIESEIANINSAISTNAGDITANADKITSLTTNLTTLQGLVNSLGDTYIDNTELSSLKAELVDADNQIKGLIETLTEKVTDIETEIANINSAISTNESDITANADKITSLTTQLTTLQGLVNSLGDTYIDNAELSSLREELVNADNQIKGLITALTTKVEKTESDIASLVSNKADVTLVTEKVEELKGLINSLDAVKNNYVTADEELKNQLTTVINNAKQQAIDSATELVNSAKAELTIAINAKADTATVNAKIEELNNAIATAGTLANAYTDGKVTELNSAIATAKQEAITAATELVNKAKAELSIAINTKADTATVNAKVEELNNAIATAGTLANTYTDGKVEELNSAIATAKQQAIDSATELVNNAKTELNAAIALKADNATVIAKFAEVDSAIAILQGLSDDYLSADTELKEELTTLIANTKAEIIELIIAGDKANADALEEEIAKLRAEIEALKNATNEDIKEAESNAQVLPTVVASVAVLGDIALLVWLIIKRKIVR